MIIKQYNRSFKQCIDFHHENLLFLLPAQILKVATFLPGYSKRTSWPRPLVYLSVPVQLASYSFTQPLLWWLQPRASFVHVGPCLHSHFFCLSGDSYQVCFQFEWDHSSSRFLFSSTASTFTSPEHGNCQEEKEFLFPNLPAVVDQYFSSDLFCVFSNFCTSTWPAWHPFWLFCASKFLGFWLRTFKKIDKLVDLSISCCWLIVWLLF